MSIVPLRRITTAIRIPSESRIIFAFDEVFFYNAGQPENKNGRKYILTKNELIKTVSDNTGMTQKVAEEAIGAALSVIANELECGGNVQILGFGTFEVKERAARTGRNPHTGETIEIPAAKVVSFKAGKALRERINN